MHGIDITSLLALVSAIFAGYGTYRGSLAQQQASQNTARLNGHANTINEVQAVASGLQATVAGLAATQVVHGNTVAAVEQGLQIASNTIATVAANSTPAGVIAAAIGAAQAASQPIVTAPAPTPAQAPAPVIQPTNAG